MELEQLRREYLRGGLSRSDLDSSPFRQFELWLEQAVALEVQDPTAMVLSTVSEQGQPSQRIVLLKHFGEKGLVFYTNYRSRKAVELERNCQVSVLFPWHGIDRQVKVCGQAAKISAAESLKYFITRPRESQLAAWASEQSHPISSRQYLLDQLQTMKDRFSSGDVPLPDFWGGYRIVPEQFEFWQGGSHRLHDRFEYFLHPDGSWTVRRLAP